MTRLLLRMQTDTTATGAEDISSFLVFCLLGFVFKLF